MANLNFGNLISLSAVGGSGISTEWRRWIAENLLLRIEPPVMLDLLVKNGIQADTAIREIQEAMNHPYVQAARGCLDAAPRAGAPSNSEARVAKRDWVLEIYRRSARQGSANGQVPHVSKPSRQQFLDQFYSQNRPVVIEGVMNDWPAMTRWTPDYFKSRFGDRVVEVQANRASDANYEANSVKHKKEMPFGEYVDIVEAIGSSNDYYITANNDGKNKENLKELWEDIILFPDYLSENDPKGRGFFWYGPQGTVTPLHHDLTNNFMAQVRGKKLVRLIPPYDLANMYNYRHCFSRVDLDRVDYDKYPQFKNVTVLDVELHPGQALFLPVGWWHYVRGLEISITMTFTNFVFDNDFYSSYTTYGDL
ncbi:MAG: cupin-like domain-containing protein [Gemmataceae bacterium]|nr:cupin-like domain-containing protein [Gemmataceae bacterium]